MPSGLVSGEACLPGSEMAPFSLCPLDGLSSGHPERERERFGVSSFFIRPPLLLDQGPTLMTSFNLES